MASTASSVLAPLLRQSPARQCCLRASRLSRSAATSIVRPTHISSSSQLSSPFSRLLSARFAHSIPRPPPRTQPTSSATESQTSETNATTSRGPEGNNTQGYNRKRVEYQLTLTCNPCGHRSTHNISKQAYHHGSALITCPECRNRHVISDHLGIFGDRKITVEDLMREKGQLVKKGSLGEDGDIEFWQDDLPAGEEQTKTEQS